MKIEVTIVVDDDSSDVFKKSERILKNLVSG